MLIPRLPASSCRIGDDYILPPAAFEKRGQVIFLLPEKNQFPGCNKILCKIFIKIDARCHRIAVLIVAIPRKSAVIIRLSIVRSSIKGTQRPAEHLPAENIINL